MLRLDASSQTDDYVLVVAVVTTVGVAVAVGVRVYLFRNQFFRSCQFSCRHCSAPFC